MAEWLIQSKQLTGLSREELIEKLGPPDGGRQDPRFADWYYLGPPSLVLADTYLCFAFDAHDRVIEAYISCERI